MATQPPQTLPLIPFFYSIKLIAPDFSRQAARYSKPPQPSWVPPNRKEAFEVLDRGVWYLWRPGDTSPVAASRQHTIQTYSTTSMFWCHDRQAFLQVPYDCTEKNPAEALHDGRPLHWDVLSFQHTRLIQNRCIAHIGYAYENNQLDARGSPNWMPKLLPERYKCPAAPQHPGTCQLAGNLSILVALVAFSTTSGQIHEVIKNAFRRNPDWVPHGEAGAGRIHQRGIVVRIGIEPQHGITEGHLRALERGPIFL